MMVSVALPDPDPVALNRFVLSAPQLGGVLGYEADVGAGVRVGVDLMAPGRWQSISTVAVDDASGPVLRELIGVGAVDELRRLATPNWHPRPDQRDHSLSADTDHASRWLRIAHVDGLDRWLQLPLDQSLVDAERGVARGQAARALPSGGETRQLVLGDALHLARAAAGGVRRYLRAAARRRHALPPGLHEALRILVDGYADLIAEVDGPDRELSSVVAAWRPLSSKVAVPPVKHRSSHPERPKTSDTAKPRAGPHRRRQSMIDPRQVRSRVFALSADPASAEVTMRNTQVGDHPAILVRVPAFQRALDPQVVPRLLVRLLDPLTADAWGETVLTVAAPAVGRPRARSDRYFEGVVTLDGTPSANLRADVFDALSDVPPATLDTDERLNEVRRATVFLSDWRRIIALAHLPVDGVAPVSRLGELATRLQPDSSRVNEPLFSGGPTAADLDRIADDGDEHFLGRVRAQRPVPEDRSDRLFSSVSGAGRLLVAELAAGLGHSSGL